MVWPIQNDKTGRPIEILFEDTHLVVLSKPAGLLSQGEASGDPNLVDELRARFGRHYVGLIHRLDRNTSGLMVVAKRSKSANRLSEQLRSGKLERTYLAWLVGEIPANARWRHRLEKDSERNRVRIVESGGQEAILQVRPLRTLRSQTTEEARITLAEFRLETGRSHQIRAQSAAEGHPLLGDVKYGSKNADFLKAQRIWKIPRPALHSAALNFDHPMSGERMSFESPLPPDMAINEAAAPAP